MSLYPRDVCVQVFQWTFSQIIEKLRENRILYKIPNKLSNVKKSRIIENAFIKIPMPIGVFVCYPDFQHPKYQVVVGEEIVQTLYSFVIEESFVLRNLEYFPELEGKTFSELEPMYKRRLLETYWGIYVISRETNNDVVQNIAERYMDMLK